MYDNIIKVGELHNPLFGMHTGDNEMEYVENLNDDEITIPIKATREEIIKSTLVQGARPH